MAQSQPSADPALRDLAWIGYHPRAMAPAIGVAAAASLVVSTGRWYLEDLSDFAERAGTLAVFVTAWGLWPALAALFLYRTVTYTYRLTDRALLVEFGFLAPPVPPVPLEAVDAVVTGQGWLGRRLGVGWVEVRAGARVVRLRGVRNPADFAVTLRDAVARAKEGK
jgi:membrane protein YdbS with pleckstrin-like domain